MSVRIYNTAPGGGGGGGAQTIQQVLNTGNLVEAGPTFNQRFSTLAGFFLDLSSSGIVGNNPAGTNPNFIFVPGSLTFEDNLINSHVITRFGWAMQDVAGNTNAGTSTDIQLNGISVALKPQVNAQVGTTYTFAIGDDMNYVTGNNAALQTYTVPTNASVAFRIGATIQVIQIGAGKITYAAAGGVTINSKGGNLSNNGQYVGVSLVKTGTNTWELMGDLTA